jgi:hypothetical protein
MPDAPFEPFSKTAIALIVGVAALSGALVTNAIASVSARVDEANDSVRYLEVFAIDHQKLAEYRFGEIEERGKWQARATQELSVNRSQALVGQSTVSEARIRALENQVADLQQQLTVRQ